MRTNSMALLPRGELDVRDALLRLIAQGGPLAVS